MDSIHEGHGEGHERRLFGMARQLFGVRAALELRNAGVFGDTHLHAEGSS